MEMNQVQTLREHLLDIADEIMQVRDHALLEMGDITRGGQLLTLRDTVYSVAINVERVMKEQGEDQDEEPDDDPSLFKLDLNESDNGQVEITPDEAESFGDFVTRARTIRGLSLKGLSSTSGVSEITIRKIEDGVTKRPQNGTVRRLARALGVTQSLVKSYYQEA